MAVIANLALKDRLAAVTQFVPALVQTGKIARWIASATYPLLAKVVELNKSYTPGVAGSAKLVSTIRLPYASAAPGADPAISAGSVLVDIRVTVANTAPQTVIDDALAMTKDYVSSTVFAQSLNANREMPSG